MSSLDRTPSPRSATRTTGISCWVAIAIVATLALAPACNGNAGNSLSDGSGTAPTNEPPGDGGAQPPGPDSDGDGIVDAEDGCPSVPNPGQEDRDRDNIPDACDNCPDNLNPFQLDQDRDGIGNACDESEPPPPAPPTPPPPTPPPPPTDNRTR